jgi:hypothetical protein
MRFQSAAILIGALALAACGDDDETTEPVVQNANVKVVHAVANAGTVAVSIDGATPAITGFNFREIRPANPGQYIQLPAGQRQLRVLLSNGTGAAAISESPTLAANLNYTVVAAGTAGGSGALAPAYILLTDDITAPAAGQVRIRAVHAASSVPNVDIHASATSAVNFSAATRVFTNVPFRASGAITVPANNYTLCVIGAGTTPTANGSNCAILAPTGALAAGTVATGFATDAPTTGGAPALILTVDRAP